MAGMSEILDPLQFVEPEFLLEDPFAAEEGARTLPSPSADRTCDVLLWSLEQVRSWLEHSVPFEYARLQELAHVFYKEGVDGLSLLTLQRSHRACVGMSDSEWLLLKAARRWLMARGNRPSTPPLKAITAQNTSLMTPPSTPPSTSGGSISKSQERPALLSPRKQWSIPSLKWVSAKDEQLEALEREVQSLRGEIVSSEERETTLQAQVDHVDVVLRTAQLAGYLETRMRWKALPGEPPVDETDVDDWVLRFLVLRGSSICFYLRATDLRPQGTIIRHDIVEAGPIPQQLHHQGDPCWSAFQITTCHGLRLECSSVMKLQVECWLSAICAGYNYRNDTKLSPPVESSLSFSAAWLKVLPPLQDSDPHNGEEGALFGED